MNYLTVAIALGLAYFVAGATGSAGPQMLSVYTLLNSKEALLTLAVTFLCIMCVLTSWRQWVKQRSHIKAAMTMRRAPKLRQHMIDGVKGGSFAYLSKQVAYGTEGSWLPPMAEVFVICDMEEIEPDPTREPTMLVVPYFRDVPTSRPSIAVQVPASDLFKHVPRNMIPELI